MESQGFALQCRPLAEALVHDTLSAQKRGGRAAKTVSLASSFLYVSGPREAASKKERLLPSSTAFHHPLSLVGASRNKQKNRR